MDHLSTDWKRRFRRRVHTWFRKNRRDLPWRATRDPYHVAVSEVMLQQTQVATVRDYFSRFIRRFPTVHALAAAGEQEVLREWEGLGYYRRARHLHAAAKAIVALYGGEFPREAGELATLPGIGRYTAGAIASIAFDARAAILEANTERLLARLIACNHAPKSAAGQKTLWAFAESLLPRRDVGEFNQALMELGSLVCTPKEPRCWECPVQSLCRARALGVVAAIPPLKPRPAYEAVHEAAVVVRRNGSVLLRKCGAAERWAGLWDFPRVSIEPASGETPEDAVVRRVSEQFGAEVTLGEHLATIQHGVTRFRITLTCYSATLTRRHKERRDGAQLKWTPCRNLAHLPLSTTGRKIANSLLKNGHSA